MTAGGPHKQPQPQRHPLLAKFPYQVHALNDGEQMDQGRLLVDIHRGEYMVDTHHGEYMPMVGIHLEEDTQLMGIRQEEDIRLVGILREPVGTLERDIPEVDSLEEDMPHEPEDSVQQHIQSYERKVLCH